MGFRCSVPVLPGVHVLGPPNKPVRPWHWAAAIAALVVVAGCASGEGPPAETTSSGAYTTTPPPLSPPPPAPPQAQPAASQCNPHYSGACVPIDRGDVDCAGGNGNGPEYFQGPVYVVGQDIYGLDADGNGIGCEPDVVSAGPEDLSECDPNYSGACVPIASDVDCEGGNGNGPAYVRGPMNVVGEDIYGLDRNSDGVGCESSVVNAGLEDLVVPEDCEQVNRAQPAMTTQRPSPPPTTQTPTPAPPRPTTQTPPGEETPPGGSSGSSGGSSGSSEGGPREGGPREGESSEGESSG